MRNMYSQSHFIWSVTNAKSCKKCDTILSVQDLLQRLPCIYHASPTFFFSKSFTFVLLHTIHLVYSSSSRSASCSPSPLIAASIPLSYSSPETTATMTFDFEMFRYRPSLVGAIVSLVIFFILSGLHFWQWFRTRQIIILCVVLGAMGKYLFSSSWFQP